MNRPYYLGIAANYSGTSSMHHLLMAHPEVSEHPGKELHFWDRKIRIKPKKSISWYWDQFENLRGKCGEITPEYYTVPDLPELLHQHLPDVRLIWLLRDPAPAFLSHYQKRGTRKWFLSLPDYVDKALAGETNDYFIAARRYVEHLERWLAFFPREQMWIVQSEKFWSRPHLYVSYLWKFLEVQNLPLPYPWINRSERKVQFPEVEARLREYFRPHNERLYALLGERYEWK